MQSGKTGTCKYVLQNMQLLYPDITKNNCYYICGMNDNDLRDQAKREFRGLISKQNILFSKKLYAYNNAEEKVIISPTILIIDESHYAGMLNSQVDIFINNINIDTSYIISVSATPMSEIATSIDFSKKIIVLKPGPDYYGITDLFDNELIHQSACISTDFEKFADILIEEYDKQRLSGKWKYGIVRLPNQFYTSDIESELHDFITDIHFINHHYVMNEVVDFNDHIKCIPDKMTIIWIYNSLRAGKQLNTKNVGFVYDTYRSNTDTTAQALLGRILGYNKKLHKVCCYTDVASATRMLNWIKEDYALEFIPMASKNILNGQRNRRFKKSR